MIFPHFLLLWFKVGVLFFSPCFMGRFCTCRFIWVTITVLQYQVNNLLCFVVWIIYLFKKKLAWTIQCGTHGALNNLKV